MTLNEQVEKRVYERLRAFDGLELAGNEPVDSSIASVLSEGEVLADDGEQYASIQDAVDASDGWTFVGPGTYYENVTIDKDDFTLKGAGYDTLIDGGTTGNSISIISENVVVTDLSVRTSPDSGKFIHGIFDNRNNAKGATIKNVTVRDSSGSGIRLFNSTDVIITNCKIETAENLGILTSTRGIVSNCKVLGTRNSVGIYIVDDDAIIVNNLIKSVAGNSIRSGGNDQIVGGNRIINSGEDGIIIQKSDSIVFNNRISDSVNQDINDNGTGTVTDGNLTGSAN